MLFQQLLQKAEGQRTEWEYPFAVTGVNLTFMLQEVVDLRDRRVGTLVTNRQPTTAPGRAFLELLPETVNVFEQVRHILLKKHGCLQEHFHCWAVTAMQWTTGCSQCAHDQMHFDCLGCPACADLLHGLPTPGSGMAGNEGFIHGLP